MRPAPVHPAVGRHMVVLAGSLALSWAVVQLTASAAAETFRVITGTTAYAGLAPAMYLLGWALAGLTAGRVMDRRGRRWGLMLGFLTGCVAAGTVFAGTRSTSVPIFLAGITLMGAAGGAVNLARAAAADMHPPERRARGIAFVLVGAAFGAIFSPLAFRPLLAGADDDPVALAVPWLAAGVMMGIGALLVSLLRPDPMEIGRLLQPANPAQQARPERARRIPELLELPNVRVALLAAVIAQTVMSVMMTIIGVALREHGHRLSDVTFTLSIHFLGMFALVPVVGILTDRIGRKRAIVGGLAVQAVGLAALVAGAELAPVMVSMFLIGLGWNVAFVAATAAIADATRPNERGVLLGFADFAAIGTAALVTIAAGLVLDAAGLTVLALCGASIAAAAAAVTLARHEVPQPR